MDARTSGFLSSKIFFPFQGLNTTVPSTMLSYNKSPDIRNMEIEKGNLKRRFGLRHTATTENPDVPITFEGDVLGIINFVDSDNVQHLVCVTTKYQYLYVSATAGWTNISKVVGTEPVAWTGNLTNQLDYDVHTDTLGVRWLIITNGLDAPQKWNGSGTFVDFFSGTNNAGITTFRTIIALNNRVLIGNFVAGGEIYHNTIAWSRVGTADAFEGGNSGYQVLTDVEGDIRMLLRLGSQTVIYTDGSIVTMSYLGSGYGYSFNTVLNGIQLLNSRSIFDAGPFHILACVDNIYAFDGTNALTAMGEEICYDLRQMLDTTKTYANFVYHNPVRRRAYWKFSFNDGTNPVYIMDYDFQRGCTWSRFYFGGDLTTIGQVYPVDSPSWNSATFDTVTWADLQKPWWSYTTKSSHPTLIFAWQVSEGVSQIFEFDETQSTDDGTEFTGVYTTPDITVPQEYKSLKARWCEIEVEAMGNEMEVLVSTDQGQNLLPTVAEDGTNKVTLDMTWKRYKLMFDEVSDQLRIIIRSNSHFEIRAIIVWFNVEARD